MKKRFFVGALALVALVGCASNGEGGHKSSTPTREFYNSFEYLFNSSIEVQKPSLYGDVESVDIGVFSASEKFGDIVIEDRIARLVYEFNQAGDVIAKSLWDGDKAEMTKMEYNADETCSKFSRYNEDGELVSCSKMEYDKSGHIVTERQFDAEGNETMRACFECDAKGNVVKYTNYSSEGEVESLVRQKFDSNDRIVEVSLYGYDGDVDSHQNFVYDKRGNLVRETYQYGDDYEDESVYRYDSKDNLVERVNDGYYYKYTTSYTYNPSGKVIEAVTKQQDKETGKEEFSGARTYEYDDKGNVVRYVNYDYKGVRRVPSCVVSFDITYR